MGSANSHPKLFSGNSSFAPEVSRGIVQSEIEGGVDLSAVPEGSVLLVETENRSYRIELLTGRNAKISGHPVFCPEPTCVVIRGSNWGGSMLKMGYIGRGMHLEFQHPEFKTISTSRILDVRAAATS
jgi:hypothetical protein